MCDAGGWTDTWFAGHGLVCNLAVRPGVEVRLEAWPAARPGIRLEVPSFGDAYEYRPDDPPGRHPLLEAAIRRWAPARWDLEIEVRSAAPVGCGAGGSAAVVVALVGALRSLATGEAIDPTWAARVAHEVETVELGWQSGIQDQLASAHGGALLVTMDRYPRSTVRPLDVPTELWVALGARLVTVYLGRPHRSTVVHEEVIAHLERGTSTEALLAPLRLAARRAAGALEAGDLDAYGAALVLNTDAQAALDPQLISGDAQSVIDAAKRHGAFGWKVNGAGGDGGSVTVVGGEDVVELRAALAELPGVEVLDLQPTTTGLHVVDDRGRAVTPA